ncbi:hypothetical protein U1Q18_037578, partial [Sarracenia purpurea var. burkii]
DIYYAKSYRRGGGVNMTRDVHVEGLKHPSRVEDAMWGQWSQTKLMKGEGYRPYEIMLRSTRGISRIW